MAFRGVWSLTSLLLLTGHVVSEEWTTHESFQYYVNNVHVYRAEAFHSCTQLKPAAFLARPTAANAEFLKSFGTENIYWADHHYDTSKGWVWSDGTPLYDIQWQTGYPKPPVSIMSEGMFQRQSATLLNTEPNYYKYGTVCQAPLDSTTSKPTTAPPTTPKPQPTTAKPEPTTPEPTTATPEPTTPEPTTPEPTTAKPEPTTPEPTTPEPTTAKPEPTTPEPTTPEPTTAKPEPTTPEPTTVKPEPTTPEPTTPEPTTAKPQPTTIIPTIPSPTASPTAPTPAGSTSVRPEPSSEGTSVSPEPSSEGTSAAPNVCPQTPGWLELATSDGSCYYLSEEDPAASGLSWGDAEQACSQQQQAHLASVPDLLTFYALSFDVKTAGQDAWTALVSVPGVGYGWSDDTPFDPDLERFIMAGPGSVGYLSATDGLFHLADASQSAAYLCRTSPPPTPSTTAAPPVTPCPADWQQFDQTCYLFSESRGYWTAAAHACREQEADLVSIHDESLIPFLLLTAGNASYWSGLQEHNGTFVWQDGSTTADIDMLLPYLDPWQIGSDCVAIDKDGYQQMQFLVHDNCFAENPFVCQKPVIQTTP